MMKTMFLLLSLFICCLFPYVPAAARYQPNWDSLDARPLPEWYDEAKIGVFMHWGVFSVPSFGSVSEWFWYAWKAAHDKANIDFMQKNYPPDFTYADFAPMFKAEFYNPDEWADILQASGAKYVVFVSKHCEGFTNWPSKFSWNWNAMDVGPKRDIVGELANSIRNRTDLRFGLYHALYEWFNPLYVSDNSTGFKTRLFPENKVMPELYEIVNKYHPDIVWSDADTPPSDTYWDSRGFLAWLYNDSPVKDRVVTNDRWGAGTKCRHGGFFNCGDHFNPGYLFKHKWENCLPIDRYSWGYRRKARSGDYLSMPELLTEIAVTARP